MNIRLDDCECGNCADCTLARLKAELEAVRRELEALKTRHFKLIEYIENGE